MLRPHVEESSPLERTLLRALAALFVAFAIATALGCAGGGESPPDDVMEERR